MGLRRNLTGEYQFIPLGIRATCAGKLMTLQDFVEDFAKYTLPAGHVLAPVQAAMESR